LEKPEVSNTDERGRRVSRIAQGAGVGSLGNGFGRLLGFAVQLALARLYGPAQLGLYVLGTIIVSLANVLSQIGMDNGVVRYVSQHRVSGDDARVKGVIAQALLVTLALSVLLASALFFGAGLLAQGLFDTPTLEPVLKVFSLSLPFFTLMSMAFWAVEGFQMVKYSVWVREVVQLLVNLVLIVFFYLLGAQILGAAVAYVISMVFSSALALVYLRKIFPQIADRKVPAVFESRALIRVSAPMIVANLASMINNWTSTLVVGVFATAGSVGIYNTAARTAVLGSIVLVAFNSIFSPIVAELHQRDLMLDLDILYKDVSRWVFTFGLLFFLGTVLLARDMMAVFGPRFVSGWLVLIIVAASQLIITSVGPTQRILAMTGRQLVLMYVTVGSLVLNVVLNLLLVPPYGIVGAGASWAAATVIYCVFTLLLVNMSLGLWPYSASYLKPVLVGILAAAATYLLRLVFPLPQGALAVLAFGSLYTILFAGGLLVAGLNYSDWQFLYAVRSAMSRKTARKADVS
jgi:O-antigen/teichoic acid export membrane protein